MKYILAKDLPFAKAGTEAFIDFEGDVYIKESPQLRCVETSQAWLGTKENLLSSGWIKEAKPRVGWLFEDNDGAYIFYPHGAPIVSDSWDKKSKWIEVTE